MMSKKYSKYPMIGGTDLVPGGQNYMALKKVDFIIVFVCFVNYSFVGIDKRQEEIIYQSILPKSDHYFS